MMPGLLFLLGALWGTGDRPPQATAAFGRAQAALAEQRCDKAVENLTAALAADPSYWEAHKAMGECLLALKRPADALRHFQHWLELRPADPSAKVMVAKASAEAERQASQPSPGAKAAAGRPASPAPRPASLGEIARSRGNPKAAEKGRVYTLNEAGGDYQPPPIPDDAPATLLDAMEKRAEEVFRPRMTAVATPVQHIRMLQRRYVAACEGKTTVQEVEEQAGGAGAGSGSLSYQSQSAWTEPLRRVVRSRNEDLPECRALASDIDALIDGVAGALNGADEELSRPPSVYPGIRERVFARLADELW